MNSKFNELFDKIITESKKSTRKHIIKEDSVVETEAKKKPEATIEEKKQNFKSICKQLRKAFKEHRSVKDNGFEVYDEGTEDEMVTLHWDWVNGRGHDEILELTFMTNTGEATYEDNGGEGDLDLSDPNGQAEALIDEYVLSDGDYDDQDEDDDSDIDDW